MEKEETTKVNREYKDRLFKFIFREKKDLLELYNAINDTAYDDPEAIEVNTMEDVVYMGMRNDLSFLVMDVLNLYEHQSTYSPNLPLRGLFYFADLYRGMVGERQDLYSSKRIELPMPQFVIFYNGMQSEPERSVLKLSDAFGKGNPKMLPGVECTAVMLNINLGSNAWLMEKSKRLREYVQFVACVRENLSHKMRIGQAVDEAVETCLRKGILEDILSKNRQEVRDMLLTEYNEELHLRNERQIALEEGEQRKLISQVRKKIQKSLPPEQIADILEEDVTVITHLCEIIGQHPKWQDAQVYEEYCRMPRENS